MASKRCEFVHLHNPVLFKMFVSQARHFDDVFLPFDGLYTYTDLPNITIFHHKLSCFAFYIQITSLGKMCILSVDLNNIHVCMYVCS